MVMVDGRWSTPNTVVEQIENYWKEINLKKILMEENEKRRDIYRFIDGPPYANNVPHVGHGRNLTYKDFFLKLEFLLGKKIETRPGWDVHGTPIEVAVQKEKGIKSREEIEKIGLETFEKMCWEHATRYASLWKGLYEKLDVWYRYFDNYYTTADLDYMEEEWKIFKEMWKQGLIKREKRVVWWCPSCGTALSGYEVVDEYKEVEDPSIYVLFPTELDGDKVYLLAWTTTPWTLPANSALAVHPEGDYVLVENKGRKIILAEKRLEVLEGEYRILKRFRGKELDGLRYSFPLSGEGKVVLSIPLLKKKVASKVALKKGGETEAGHLVSLEEGTGVVHIAPGHGREDFELGKLYKLPLRESVDDKGRMVIEPWKGVPFTEANKLIIERLKELDLLYKEEKIVHRYPFCWRCKHKLLQRPSLDFFVEVEKFKDRMVEFLEKTRFNDERGKRWMISWISGLKDWDISRYRFWGTPVPVWICNKCGKMEVFTKEELEERANVKLNDLHRSIVDKITLRCECGGEMRRVKEIFDVWFDSGSGRFAVFHDKKPMSMVVEAVDQFRGWFDTLTRISVAVEDLPAFEQVFATGWVVDEKGEKMSKSKGNVVWLKDALDTIPTDFLRFYYCYKQSAYETMNFSLKEAEEVARKFFNMLLNLVNYVKSYEKIVGKGRRAVEDEWIEGEVRYVLSRMREYYERMDVYSYTRAIVSLVEKLSRDYVQAVRERVQIEGDSEPIRVLKSALKDVSVALFPIAPHYAEYIYTSLGFGKTVVLEKFPEGGERYEKWEEVEKAFRLAEEVYRLREEVGLKRRWRLPWIVVKEKVPEELFLRLANAERVIEKPEGEYIEGENVVIPRTVPDEVKIASELSRKLRELRKKKGFKIGEKVKVVISPLPPMREWIERRVDGELMEGEGEEEIEVLGKSFRVSLVRA